MQCFICKHTIEHFMWRKLGVQMTELCKFLRGILEPPTECCHLFSLVSCSNGLRLNNIFVFNLENVAYECICAFMSSKHTRTHADTHFATIMIISLTIFSL